MRFNSNPLRTYGFSGLVKMLFYILRTKLFYPGSRLIRFPIDIRGKRYIKFGKNLTTGKHCRIEAYPDDSKSIVLHLGNDVQLNDYVHISAMQKVQIGDNVLMASKIYISDCTHGSYKGDEHDSSPDQVPVEREYYISPVNIKKNVWIGESVSILPGVTVGEGSIIGANSVVTKDIPDYCIAVGNPAGVIKKFNRDKKIWERINK